MNKEAKEMWIDALRSGKYKQGKSFLKNYDNTYCCLGVLVEVFEHHYGLKFDREINGNSHTEFGSCRSSISPPDIVSNWINISPRHQALLVNLNDKHNCSFEGIADVLMNLD